MSRVMAVFSVVLATLVCVVMSQEGPPPGRGFGFGAFAFGGPGGPPDSSVTLLATPEVRTELGLTPDQQKPLEQWLLDTQGKLRDVMTGVNFQDFPNLSPEERDRQFAELRRKGEEAGKTADEQLPKLLTESQRKRLTELQLQRAGIQALLRPEISKSLQLTRSQVEQIEDLKPEGFGPFPPPPDAQERALTEAVALLSDEQKTKWTELKGKDFTFPAPSFGPPGFGGPGGPGGPMGGQERAIVKQFDKDGDKRLNNEERKAAREFLKTSPAGGGRGPGGPFGGGPGGRGGPPGGRGPRHEPGQPGPRVAVSDVQPIPDAPLYDTGVLRTLFLNFENEDWEAELSDFHNTDVEVPATLTVDGREYPGVGIHFRGMSSYGMVPAGSKRSFNVSIDFTDEKQRLYGYKTLNLLNAHEDATFMNTVLYSEIARRHIAAPKANFVKVVVNGESWGVYVNAQQFDKLFVAENFQSPNAARWKVRGSPGGAGGLEYLGDDVAAYKRRYENKSGDNAKNWQAFITLCKTLNETPPDKLEAALSSMLDIDGALWFLALDVTLINGDGYWVRASDYSIALDESGRFHIIPHDMNEAFRAGGGPGFGFPGGRGGFGPPGGGRPGSGRPGQGRPGQDAAPGEEGRPGQPGNPPPREGERPDRSRGRPGRGGPGGFAGPGMGPGGAGIELDPLIGLDDASKPLRSKLLAVPALKERYLSYVRELAETALDWKTTGPLIAKWRALLEEEIKADTRKLSSYEEFVQATSEGGAAPPEARGRGTNLKSFLEKRQAFLLEHPEIKKLKR